MKKELSTWKFIHDSVSRDIPVVLLYVLQSSGSSPGRAGFLMAVNQEGEINGSIGGGIMEYKFVEMAKSKLSEDKSFSSVHKQVHDKSAAKDQSGMICSGEQVIWLYQLTQHDLGTIAQIINHYENRSTAIISINNSGIKLLPSDEQVRSTGLTGFSNDSNIDQQDQQWQYFQRIAKQNQLHIVGGGHCSLAVSELMHKINFYVRIYDDRKELNTMAANNFADEQITVDDYNNIDQFIKQGESVYVVIMTFGYRTDDIVLRKLMDKEFSYLGCLGSRKKIEKMFSDYRQEGIPETILSKIHAPIGIQIKSQTPEEIAVSIAAEIIKVKNMLL